MSTRRISASAAPLYYPTARAAEILGDRWTLLIVRDLLFGAQHFNALERGLPGIPKALLAERLRRLQQFGVVERSGDPHSRKTRYTLTPARRELYAVVESLTRWGVKWAFGEPEPAELNPVLLLWWMRDRVDAQQLPPERVVVEFRFEEQRRDCFWLVLQPEEVSVCLKHPGYESDLIVRGELNALYQVWFGRLTLPQVLRDGRLELDRVPALVRAFPKWFQLSPAAGIVRST